VQVDARLTPGCLWVDRARFQRLKLKYDEALSNFAFKINLRRYTEAEEREKVLANLLKEEAAARSELEGQLRDVQATVGGSMFLAKHTTKRKCRVGFHSRDVQL